MPFPYTRQQRAAAAAATHLNIFGIIITGLLPYMENICRIYGKGP